MTAKELDQTLDIYDDVTSDVRVSNSSTFETNLERWFEIVDETPILDRVARELEARVNFPVWYKQSSIPMSSFAGSGNLRWPSGSENRIGMQIALFRAILSGNANYLGFYSAFFAGSDRLDDMVMEITNQVFGPMSLIFADLSSSAPKQTRNRMFPLQTER